MIFLISFTLALSSSQRVYWTTNGAAKQKYLTYTFDTENNRIPHFSYAGFRHGNYSTPITAKVIKTLYPPTTDGVSLIQNAINFLSTMPVDINGFRGTIVLKKGLWTIGSTIYISVNGIVLQGEGNGDDPKTSTVLKITGNGNQDSVFRIGNSKVNWYAANSIQIPITTRLVGLSAFKFQVSDVARFIVGQSILIVYPANQAWLNAVNRGDTYSDAPWGLGFPSVNFLRKVIAIDVKTKTLFLDSPTFEKMDSSISQPYVILFDDSKVVKNVVIRDIRIQIKPATTDPEDENHAQNGIIIDGTQDVWIYKCVISGFVRSGVAIYTSTRVSVTNSAAINPIGKDVPDNFYNFSAERNAQLILFAHNFARGGRHQYVVNGMSTSSGVVFFDSTSINPSAVDESHRGWSTGILYDYMLTTIAGNYASLGLYNRGSFGTSHGWSCAHCVAWGCKFVSNQDSTKVMGGIMVQKPPTAQNYAIGNTLQIASGAKPPCPFQQKTGWVESFTDPDPASLYLAQKQTRLNKGMVAVDYKTTDKLIHAASC